MSVRPWYKIVEHRKEVRLKVTIDYRAAQGRIGPRTVEPYSLRRSRQGNLLVYVVNDRGQLRCYRADRIHAVSVEPEKLHPSLPRRVLTLGRFSNTSGTASNTRPSKRLRLAPMTIGVCGS